MRRATHPAARIASATVKATPHIAMFASANNSAVACSAELGPVPLAHDPYCIHHLGLLERSSLASTSVPNKPLQSAEMGHPILRTLAIREWVHKLQITFGSGALVKV